MKIFYRKKTVCVCLLTLYLSACGGDRKTSEVQVNLQLTTSSTESENNEDPFVALNLPDTPFSYSSPILPEHFRINQFPGQTGFQRAAADLDNTPSDNPTTDYGATLGRVLFYDTKLSANGTVACASCHLQANGFSDPRRLSVGFDGEQTRRHSMSLANAVYYASGKFFWDERAETLEQQVLMPFQDPVEMGLVLAELEEIVANQPYYPILFANAFGDQVISSDRIAKALAQFVRSMVSTGAKYDLGRIEVASPIQDFPAFSTLENQGKDLFFLARELPSGERISCASCHISEAFVGPVPNGPLSTTTATNNGLDAESTDDFGVFETSLNVTDAGKFKVPSLRNIDVTAPYMHDGRFATLEEVIEHYSSGVQNHVNLSPQLRSNTGTALNFNFSEQEKSALVAFLRTLTDEQMLWDEKFSNPFR